MRWQVDMVSFYTKSHRQRLSQMRAPSIWNLGIRLLIVCVISYRDLSGNPIVCDDRLTWLASIPRVIGTCKSGTKSETTLSQYIGKRTIICIFKTLSTSRLDVMSTFNLICWKWLWSSFPSSLDLKSVSFSYFIVLFMFCKQV